ncbi:Shedu immune nuclease family protein [Microbispora sp. KK1-11]|uniref:Shedu immune nuclease family protein n=1 Tax=Microbispora sp. KK1-11 TaxID=2053005 RepID=UPI001157D02A|nr:Shedu immune nuclease family protein [Microbispora sp. KK1-11]TQS29063.1 DUF4263 domain-containing protein [Microbispora sp. KK1-11]
MTDSRDYKERCSECNELIEPPKSIYAVKDCDSCHRKIFRAPSADGLTVMEGETIVVPAGAIQISLDRRISTGKLTREGVSWLVRKFFLDTVAHTESDLERSLDDYQKTAEGVLENSAMFSSLDLDTEEGLNAVLEQVDGRHDLQEYWAWAVYVLAGALKEDLTSAEPMKAAWLMSRLEVARCILMYTQHLEPLVWQGYSSPGLEAMKAVVKIWDEQQNNSSEEFWQSTLTNNFALLSQILHAPLILHQDKAYLGGKNLSNHHGKYADFLLKNSVVGTAVIVEIKTPIAKLLGKQYRDNVFGPSMELAGAVAQILHYRSTLSRHYIIHKSDDAEWESADPPCIVIAGNAAIELDSSAKRDSFELYRRSLSGVEIVTFDELFGKFRQLIEAVSNISP